MWSIGSQARANEREEAWIMSAGLKTPLQIGFYLVRAFEADFEMGGNRLMQSTWRQFCLNALMQLIRHGYDAQALCTQFDVRPPEIWQLMRGTLNPQRSGELIEEIRAVSLVL